MAVHKSFCRFCHAFCGVEIEVEGGRVISLRGDRDNAVSNGFMCIKGRSLPDQHADPARLRHSLARGLSGQLEPVGAEAALDEIAKQLAAIIAAHGPRAVALYAGTAAYQNSVAMSCARSWINGLGSPSFYTSLTIDQPNKIIAPQLHGSFMGGGQAFASSDVWMVFGCNSIVSMYGGTSGFPSFNPTARVREAKARGLDLIVVDPRRSELARMADLHLQLRPGEDAMLLAGMIRVILAEKLYDAEFCARFTEGLGALEAAVAGASLERVAARTGVPAAQVQDAARRFARGPRGMASSGTGPSMGPDPNLTELLISNMNALCGRFNRAGDVVANPGTLSPPRPFSEEAMSPFPGYRMGAQSRVRGLAQVAGELPTAALADEILTEGEGRIRALVCVGGNPMAAWPDQLKTRRALEALDLLVVIDPKRTATSAFADFLIAPPLSLERPDVTMLMDAWFPKPFAMYTPALLEPPEDTLAEWEFFWGLARRMETPIALPGGAVDLERKPTADALLELVTAHSRIPLAEVKRHPSGGVFDDPPVRVQEGNADAKGRMQLAPELLVEELVTVLRRPDTGGAGYGEGEDFTHRLICRRLKEVYNSMGRDLPLLRAKRPYNPAFMHPDDLAALGVAPGERVEIRSRHGRIVGIAELAKDLQPGVISMAHAWGDLPERDDEVRELGSAVNRLVDNTRDYDPISGMALQSAIPVRVRALSAMA